MADFGTHPFNSETQYSEVADESIPRCGPILLSFGHDTQTASGPVFRKVLQPERGLYGSVMEGYWGMIYFGTASVIYSPDTEALRPAVGARVSSRSGRGLDSGRSETPEFD